MSLNVYTFGYGGNSIYAEKLRPVIEKLGMKLISIHEHDNADIKWNRQTFLQDISKADIIILPCNYKVQDSKSNNRLSQSMSLRKPVIASPLHSYVKIENENPGCVLFAETDEEWEKHLVFLRDNEDARNKMSEIGLEVSKKYSIDAIGNKWLNVFKSLEKTDIIIPTYNNVEYLKLCLNSIRKNTSSIRNIIISDAGSNEETWKFYETLGDVIVLGKSSQRLNFSQACNVAIKASKSKYFAIMNSDVIVSKNWDLNVIKKMNEYSDLAVCGVLSNCNKGWRFTTEYNMNMNGLELVPGMKIDQLENRIEELYSFMEQSNKTLEGTFVLQDWVAYYAAIYNREIINKVGLLDPGFVNGCEDLDHCIRIKKMGFKIGEALDSFVFHFGSISRASYEREF